MTPAVAMTKVAICGLKTKFPRLTRFSCPWHKLTATTFVQVDLVHFGLNSVSQGIYAMAIAGFRVVIGPVGQVKPGPQVSYSQTLDAFCATLCRVHG